MQKLFVHYNTIKNLFNSLPSYYYAQGDGNYSVFAVGDDLFIESLTTDEISKTDFENNYKIFCTETYSADDAMILGTIKNKIPLIKPRTLDGVIRNASEKPDSNKKNFFSHNWCDKTTWYSSSILVTNEQATDSSDHITYNLSHENIIDTYHGKIFGEDFIRDEEGNSYRVQVKVNDDIKIEQDPHYGTGGDYVINYKLGKIIFNSSLEAEDVVFVTYYYATNSDFIVAPDANKKLNILIAELQFSDDVDITDTAIFEVYGYVDVFAPQLMPGIPSGTKILINSVKYKTICDFQCDAIKSYPMYPEIGGNSWRGLQNKLLVLDWDYVSATWLRYDAGMEIIIKLEHDNAFGGTYATASFYCISETI